MENHKLKRLKKVRASLQPEQLEILKSKRIDGNFEPIKLLKTLKKLAIFDKYNDEIIQSLNFKAKIFLGIGIVFLVLGIFVFLAITLPIPKREIVSYVVGFFGVILIIISFIYRRKAKIQKSMDLDNNLRNFLLPLIAFVKEEIKPNTKFSLTFDATNPMDNVFLVDKIPAIGRTIYYYLNPWISSKLVLYDGTQLRFESEIDSQKHDIRKLSWSGKIKYKTKYKYKQRSLIKLSFPKKHYQLSGNDVPGTIIEHTGNAIVLKRKFVIKSSETIEMDITIFLNRIHSMYASVTPTNS